MSTGLMELNGLWGLAGWKWMYLAEAVPTVLLGIVVFFYVTDRPAKASWLTDAERNWLITTIEAERREVAAKHSISVWRSFWDPKIVMLSLNYLGIVTASLGMLLFLPQMIKQLGLTNMQVGWTTMIPYGCGAVAMITMGYVSDRMNDRRWSLFWTCLVSVAGLVIAGLGVGTWWAVVGMSIAAIGFYGTKGPFWAMPSTVLTGTAAASGIAFINSVGNLGGFFGPYIVGWVRTQTGSFAGGLYTLGAFALVSAVISLFWLNLRHPAAEQSRVGAPAE
jgi:ACS family tartrate transporter-like MFS transporter